MCIHPFLFFHVFYIQRIINYFSLVVFVVGFTEYRSSKFLLKCASLNSSGSLTPDPIPQVLSYHFLLHSHGQICELWSMGHVSSWCFFSFWMMTTRFGPLDANSFNTRVRDDQPGGSVFRKYLDLLLGSP